MPRPIALGLRKYQVLESAEVAEQIAHGAELFTATGNENIAEP